MRDMKSRELMPVMLLAAGAALAGCSSGPPRQTTADLARAHTLVASAESSGAQQYAAGDLQAARDKARQADKEADSDPQRADRLANEAAVDAQLASARTQNAKAQRALEDVSRSLQSLRGETQHNEGTQGAPGQSAPLQNPPLQNPPQ